MSRQASIQDMAIAVAVSPQPARGYVQVFILGVSLPANISLLNVQGQLVKHWQNTNVFSSAYRLDVSMLPAGMYMLKVDVASQQIVKKILIE